MSPLRATCVRCNSIIPSESFEPDWAFARCACGARSPVPAAVRARRPARVKVSAMRELETIRAARPANIDAQVRRRGGAERIQLVARLGAVGWRLDVDNLAASIMEALTRPALLRVALAARVRAGLVERVEGGGAPMPPPITHACFEHEGAYRVVLRGGHPVYEEWHLGDVGNERDGQWIGEWMAAELRALLQSSTPPPQLPKAPKHYR